VLYSVRQDRELGFRLGRRTMGNPSCAGLALALRGALPTLNAIATGG
jgi:hypothetical protein